MHVTRIIAPNYLGASKAPGGYVTNTVSPGGRCNTLPDISDRSASGIWSTPGGGGGFSLLVTKCISYKGIDNAWRGRNIPSNLEKFIRKAPGKIMLSLFFCDNQILYSVPRLCTRCYFVANNPITPRP